ncbi:radical SAM protein [Patescibacteria group bacterium]|nr:radical SAM protein [Patescibacteria group bacterium]
MNNNVVKQKKWNKVFTVTTEGPCNCRCLGCGTPRLYKPRSTAEILKDIKAGARAGYHVIEIIGGEPTIHPDFLILSEKAREMYKKIYLTSNGITLANNTFAKKVFSIFDSINITLYGHNAKLHESWTKNKGSFIKTTRGIRNCLSVNPKSVLVTHLVWKKNFPYLRQLITRDIKLGVKNIDLLNIQPIGSAKHIFKKLVVPLKELSNFGLNFIDLLDNFESVEIEDYPFCIFPKEILEKTKNNVHIIDIAGQIFLNDKKQINCYDLFMTHNISSGMDSTLKTSKNIKLIKDKMKKYRYHLNACKGCYFINECNGIFEEYVKIFGRKKVEAEIKAIRAKLS